MNLEFLEGIDWKSETELTVLTPNQRLSQYLSETIASNLGEKLNQEKVRTYLSPKVIPINLWVQEIYDSLLENNWPTCSDKLLLSPQQELSLWQQVIQESEQGQKLLLNKSCSKLAQETWNLIHQWDVKIIESVFNENLDSQTYLQWHQAFKLRCDENQWLSPSQIPVLINQALNEGILELKGKIVLYAFDDILPHHQILLDNLEKKGAIIEGEKNLNHAEFIKRCEFANPQQEIRAAAKFSHEVIKREPSSNIGIVFPNLSQQRQEIIRIFLEELDKNKLQNDANIYPLPFNISGGTALSHFPVNQIALTILSLNHFSIEIEGLSALLRSKYIVGATRNQESRNLFDLHLRKLKRKEVSLSFVIKELHYFEKLTNKKDEPLKTALETFDSLKLDSAKKLQAWQWVDGFKKQLKTFSWPGENHLDSESFQAAESFNKCFESLASMSVVDAKLNLSQAMTNLRDVSNSAVFQAKTQQSQLRGINILGSIEAAGIHFDSLWVSGMNNENWPPKATSNPFIPKNIQASLNMPHSSAERELDFCRKLQSRYESSSNSIIFSHYLREDEREFDCSPLTEKYGSVDFQQILQDFSLNLEEGDDPLRNNLYPLLNSQKNIELYGIDEPLPLQPDETVGGGQKIIQDQALCPFRAFARHRLKLKPIEEPELGLSPLEKGSLIHEIMESLWIHLKNQKTLNTYSDNKLLELCYDICKQEFSKTEISRTKNKAFLDLELERIAPIVFEWLILEKNRQPFTVEKLEEDFIADISGLKIRLRIDRIDSLEDGSFIFIDYKSGKSDANRWQTPRIEEPQLPIYTSFYPNNGTEPAALIFAQLKNGEVKPKGLAKDKEIFPTVKTIRKDENTSASPWSLQLDEWKKDILDHASDFKDGILMVNPKHRQRSCAYCEFSSLCRIEQLSQIPGERDEA